MTRKKHIAEKLNLKELLAEQEDFLRGLIQQVVQQVLEAEMEQALGAEPIGDQVAKYRRVTWMLTALFRSATSTDEGFWKNGH